MSSEFKRVSVEGTSNEGYTTSYWVTQPVVGYRFRIYHEGKAREHCIIRGSRGDNDISCFLIPSFLFPNKIEININKSVWYFFFQSSWGFVPRFPTIAQSWAMPVQDYFTIITSQFPSTINNSLASLSCCLVFLPLNYIKGKATFTDSVLFGVVLHSKKSSLHISNTPPPRKIINIGAFAPEKR